MLEGWLRDTLHNARRRKIKIGLLASLALSWRQQACILIGKALPFGSNKSARTVCENGNPDNFARAKIRSHRFTAPVTTNGSPPTGPPDNGGIPTERMRTREAANP